MYTIFSRVCIDFIQFIILVSSSLLSTVLPAWLSVHDTSVPPFITEPVQYHIPPGVCACITYLRIDFLVVHPSYSPVYLSSTLHTCLFLCSFILRSISIAGQYLKPYFLSLHDKPRRMVLVGHWFFFLPRPCFPHSSSSSLFVPPSSSLSRADSSVDNDQCSHLKYGHMRSEEHSVRYYSYLSPRHCISHSWTFDYTPNTLTTDLLEKRNNLTPPNWKSSTQHERQGGCERRRSLWPLIKWQTGHRGGQTAPFPPSDFPMQWLGTWFRYRKRRYTQTQTKTQAETDTTIQAGTKTKTQGGAQPRTQRRTRTILPSIKVESHAPRIIGYCCLPHARFRAPPTNTSNPACVAVPVNLPPAPRPPTR